MMSQEISLDFTLLDRNLLAETCRAAGADDVAFVEVDRPGLAAQRDGFLKIVPWAKSFMVFARRFNRHAIRIPLRSISSAELNAGVKVIKEIIHTVTRELEAKSIRAVGFSGSFPFEFGNSDTNPFIISLKPLAEAAGLGVMGKNRLVLHPRFGANIHLGAIALDTTVAAYDQPLAKSPCLGCNLCAAACPTGAIAKDGHFDFGSCMTHNYREKVGGFVEWVHTIADSRNRRDYRRRVSDVETLSWWQSLGYEANTHCDYCVAVCPAGEEAKQFLADRKTHFEGVVEPLRKRAEKVYVVRGSDAQAHLAKEFPHKSARFIGSGRKAQSIAAMLAMLPLIFQRGQAGGVSARYHFRFYGKECIDSTIEIRDQNIEITPGLNGRADLEIRADSNVWLSFLAKERNLLWEILRGRIRFRGNLRLLKDFGRCFPG